MKVTFHKLWGVLLSTVHDIVKKLHCWQRRSWKPLLWSSSSITDTHDSEVEINARAQEQAINDLKKRRCLLFINDGRRQSERCHAAPSKTCWKQLCYRHKVQSRHPQGCRYHHICEGNINAEQYVQLFQSFFFFFLEKVLLFSVTQKPNRILHTYEGNCPAAKPACLQSGPVPAGGLWNKTCNKGDLK